MSHRFLFAFVSCAALLSSRFASAEPIFFSVDVNGGVGLIGSGAQPTPQSLDTGIVENRQFVLNSIGRATASASFGHVGGHADIQSMRGDSTDWHAGSDAVYEDYVVFSGPSGATSVLTSLNLTVGYEMGSSTGAGAGLRLVASVNGVDAEYRVSVANGNGPEFTALGLAVDQAPAFAFSGNATTPMVMVPIGAPVHIVLRMELNTGASNNGSAFVNFDNSFDFAQGRDLFTLPDGYTVNAESSFIVNNRFAPNVPEPSTLALSIAGLACLGFVTLRKKLQRGTHSAAMSS